MRKVVINKCYGGFSISDEAVEWLKAKGVDDARTYGYCGDSYRDDPLLVACVEALGSKANGHCAELKVVEIPSDVEWQIEEYDGMEHIAEVHSTWG